MNAALLPLQQVLLGEKGHADMWSPNKLSLLAYCNQTHVVLSIVKVLADVVHVLKHCMAIG